MKRLLVTSVDGDFQPVNSLISASWPPLFLNIALLNTGDCRDPPGTAEHLISLQVLASCVLSGLILR